MSLILTMILHCSTIQAAILTMAPAPLQKEGPKPTIAEMRDALGKRFSSREMTTVGRQLGNRPEIWFDFWIDNKDATGTHFYLTWKPKGVEMSFREEKLVSIWLNNEGAEGHHQYKGELPYGLKFDDDAKAVMKKLGPASEIYDPLVREKTKTKKARVDQFYYWHHKGIQVFFTTPEDENQRIFFIQLFTPKKDE